MLGVDPSEVEAMPSWEGSQLREKGASGAEPDAFVEEELASEVLRLLLPPPLLRRRHRPCHRDPGHRHHHHHRRRRPHLP